MDKSAPQIYLAGPIAGNSYQTATDWRIEATLKLAPIKTLNPMRGKDYLKKENDILDHYVGKNIIEDALSGSKGVVTRDRRDVMNCDGVLMNLIGATKVSIGTMIEAGWADAYRKPIVLVIDENNIHLHGMLLEMSGFIVNDLDQAAEVLKAIFL